MISDTVDRLPLYEALIPEAGKIARAFQSKVPSDVSCEVREKSYALKEDTARRFEVHFHTIDLMIAREGAETMQFHRQFGQRRQRHRTKQLLTTSKKSQRKTAGQWLKRLSHGC